MNDNYCNSNMPNAPMSPTEEDLPPGFGRRTGRQTSWNDSDRRPTSYYDGLKSDSERRDERMASLDALRKRREIPVSVRIRSSSLGRDRASILSEAVDPKRNDETLTARGTRNIIDLRSRSSSLTRDGKVVDPIERSRRSISSMHENISNTSDQTVLEKLLHRREKHENSSAAKEGRRRLSRGDIDMDVDESCRDCRAFSPRPQSLPISSNLVESWNGELKNERGSKEAVEAENSAKKKGRRISRFLRPDFFDTPREESVFAKKKEAEAAENALVENEKKQREQHLMGSFLHSLEKRLDKLRGGERSKKSNPPETEQAVALDEPVSVAPGCLTSTKLTAEVRKAKLIGTDDSNLDGMKKGIASSRVDRAINSLLQREKGKTKKEVSESGLIKRAVGIDERGCPSKSRSSGELARLSVTGGCLLGKPVSVQTNLLPLGGETDVNGVGMENGVGTKFSNKVNAMLAMFRRNEVEHVPFSRTARLRRTQSVAYDKSVPDDILSAISGHDALKNNGNATSKSETESKTPQTESANKLVNKTEKVKKSSKSTKEKSSIKSKASPLKEKKVTAAKTEKTIEDTAKESMNEKLPNPYVSKKLADSMKDKVTTTSLEKKSDTMNIKNAKCLKNEITETATKPSSNSTSMSINESNSMSCTPLHANDRHASKSKVESLNNKSLDNGPVKLQINPPYESKKEIKDLDNIESAHSANLKQLDRTATQDSLDSSWSACSDGLADMGGSVRERGKISRQEGEGLGMIDYADPDAVHSNCINSPSLTVMDDSGERVSGKGEGGVGDDDSEESVGDRIRRKSFYCRFNEVPSRRKSRVGRKSSASSLLYSDHSWSPLDLKPDHPQNKSLCRSSGSGRSSSSVSPASAMEGNSLDSSLVQLSYRTNTESKKPELTSNLSRESFSPPPLPYKRSSGIYRRSSTSPYQERVPSTDPLLHSTPQTTGLRPTSSANSLARSNSSSRAASEVEDESRLTGSKRGEEGGHITYIPSPLSPSSSMCNSYHNGISPSVLDEVSLDQDRKSIRSRKLGVPSMADGITKPSPTHRKYNRYSSYCSSDGLTSSSAMKESGPFSPTTEHTSQRMHPVGLPPMGIPISNKLRTMRNSSGYE